MKKTIILSSCILMLSSLCSCGVKVYSSKDYIEKEFRTSKKINSIESYAFTDIEYTQGEPSIKLYAPSDFIQNIEIRVENGNLIIGQKDTQNLIGQVKSKLVISYPDITTFATYGTGDIKIKGFNGEKIILKSEGTGDIECELANTESMYAETYGTGDIELDDINCNEGVFITNGTGDIEIKSIKANKLDAKSFGTGDIEISGSCNVITHESSGTGTINTKKLKIK